jgi:hypothetical protein
MLATKLVFTFCKMFENVRFLADMHLEFAKFADFYVDIKFIDIQTECNSKIFMTLSQRGQFILLSVVLNPSPPPYSDHAPRQCLGPTSQLSILS